MKPISPEPASNAEGRDELLGAQLEQHLEALRGETPAGVSASTNPELNQLRPIVERLHHLAEGLAAPTTIDWPEAPSASTVDALPRADRDTSDPAAPRGTPTPQSEEGERIGKFSILRPLGQGGQAATLLAFDPDLRRHVVLKLYHQALTPAEQEMVLQEGRILARVRSPYVAQCYSAERQEGVPYLVMEYIPGRSLATRDRSKPLPPAQVLELVRQLAEGLAAVHACGLLHRDVKPGNILIGDDGRPRLIDFGLALPLASEDLAHISGTLGYMAPEQARGEADRTDARSDIYALGMVLYRVAYRPAAALGRPSR
jgi:serine/threonine protein kinase